LLVGGFWAGCGGQGTPPDVPSGEFTAYVDGSLSDTLSGTVHHRLTEDGALTGIELGEKGEPGVSIDLEPEPPGLRTYEVIEAELFGLDHPDRPPGALAFLTLDRARFAAVDGTLQLTYVHDDRIGATFTFEMEGEYDGPATDGSSVEVTGALNAGVE
jgi:hypothetical protein